MTVWQIPEGSEGVRYAGIEGSKCKDPETGDSKETIVARPGCVRGRAAGCGGQKARCHRRTLEDFVKTLGFTLCEMGNHWRGTGAWNTEVALIYLLKRQLTLLLRTHRRRTKGPMETT